MSTISKLIASKIFSAGHYLLILGFTTIGVMMAIGGAGDSVAGEKRKYFKHSSSSSAKNIGSRKHVGQRNYSGYKSRSVVRHHRRHKYARQNKSVLRKNFSHGHYKSPTGPLVIDVHKVLKRRSLKITSHQGARVEVNRHVIDNGAGGVRAIYYDERKCEGGFDCVIRLGTQRSSPKLIVIGEKRSKTSGPKIIHPPS